MGSSIWTPGSVTATIPVETSATRKPLQPHGQQCSEPELSHAELTAPTTDSPQIQEIPMSKLTIAALAALALLALAATSSARPAAVRHARAGNGLIAFMRPGTVGEY